MTKTSGLPPLPHPEAIGGGSKPSSYTAEQMHDYALAALSQPMGVAAIPEGMALLPREPDRAMLEACLKEAQYQYGHGITMDSAVHLYRAMVAAAPHPAVVAMYQSMADHARDVVSRANACSPQPPAVQQDRGEALKRAAELHEKAGMPWTQALELAMSEHGISLPLYQAINKLVCQIGYEGSIASDHALVTEVMDALHDLDGGTMISAPSIGPSAQGVDHG